MNDALESMGGAFGETFAGNGFDKNNSSQGAGGKSFFYSNEHRKSVGAADIDPVKKLLGMNKESPQVNALASNLKEKLAQDPN